MAETRTYALGAATKESLGRSIESFLRSQGTMEVEGAGGDDWYLVQARLQGAEWRKFVALDKAIHVKITPMDPNMVSVSVGQGKWVDKLGVAAVGALWFPPLMLLAGFGAYSQVKLANDVYAHINTYLTALNAKP